MVFDICLSIIILSSQVLISSPKLAFNGDIPIITISVRLHLFQLVVLMRGRKTRAVLVALTLLVAFVAVFSGTVKSDNPDEYFKGYTQGFSDGVSSANANQSPTGQCADGSHYCDGYLKGYSAGYYSLLSPPSSGLP